MIYHDKSFVHFKIGESQSVDISIHLNTNQITGYE